MQYSMTYTIHYLVQLALISSAWIAVSWLYVQKLKGAMDGTMMYAVIVWFISCLVLAFFVGGV